MTPISALSGLLVAMTLWPGNKPAVPEGNVYLGNATAPAHVSSGAPVAVAIEASLPSPAYELVEPTIQKGDHSIQIHLASRLKAKKGMAIQVLVPIKRTINLGDLDDGTWRITVDAAGGDSRTLAVDVGTAD